MPFISDGRKLIRDAFERKYTLPAFNVCSVEMLRACLDAAEEEQAPIIIQTYPADLEQISQKHLVALVKSYAEDLTVPVMLHMDHGPSYEVAIACIRAGYSSVMYDGADAELEEVLTTCKKLSEVAKITGVSLEVANDSFNKGKIAFSMPEEVTRLFEEGRADMVAVSVGSEHGQSGELDLELLSSIFKSVQSPLVMHGGSGITAEEHTYLRQNGVVKTNIGSALYRTLRSVWQRSEDANAHREVYARARAALKEVAKDKIRMMDATGKA